MDALQQAAGPITMPQFFIDQALTTGTEVTVTGSDAHHILNVLRLTTGDWIVLSDGRGRSFRAEIFEATSRSVRARILNEILRSVPLVQTALAFAVIKHDRSEWIIQKAVELGCAAIVPFTCRRTIPKYANVEAKHARWQNIAIEAAKQSGLQLKPHVGLPTSFGKLCDTVKQYDKTLLFWEGERQNDLKSEISGFESRVTPARQGISGGSHGSRLLIIIGPEGGFDQTEIDEAKRQGAVTVSLGSQILRVETAAITALAIVQYELGNLSLNKISAEV